MHVYASVCEWTVHSIERKFDMYVIDHRQTNLIDFGDFKMRRFFFAIFFQKYEKELLYIMTYGV